MESSEIVEEIEKRLVSSCNIVENEVFREWFAANIANESTNFEQLFEPNMEYFQSIFGRHQFSFKIDKQYMVWRLLQGPYKMYCISHDGGTFYEVFYASNKKNFNDDQKMGETIISFIEFVLNKLNSATQRNKLN